MAKASKRAPDSFPFFWRDWCGSPLVLGMDLATQGAFLRLLCLQWEYGSVQRKMLGAVLGLPQDEVDGLLAGPLGEAFKEDGDGNLINPQLDELRLKAVGRSEQNRQAALARWSDEPKPKRKKKGARVRIDGQRELDGAVHLYAVRGPALPATLVSAMNEYRRMRAENAFPVWKKATWLKNLSDTYSHEEWRAAYETATRSEWRSVHPKKAPKGKAGNPFVEGAVFADPNASTPDPPAWEQQ
jgi:hypothetical protein